jgi:high affinity Mn2+ porin
MCCAALSVALLCVTLPLLQAGAALAEQPLFTPQLLGAQLDIHAQYTGTVQAHPAFTSPYQGVNSLKPQAEAAMTNDLTLFIGLSPWKGAELWYTPEIDQGFGLSNTYGIAAFSSAEAYKLGKTSPYYKTHRIFLRQNINLGGTADNAEQDLMQRQQARTHDRLTLTLGQFGLPDIFDTNSYAHDSRNDFLNWALVDTGSLDGAADSWDYTYGAAVELTHGALTWRTGLMALSRLPNGEDIDRSFSQRQWLGELEYRYSLGGQVGALRLTAFDSRANLGSYSDALAQATLSHMPPSTALVRHIRHREGVSLNMEQALDKNIGVFLRVGIADPKTEIMEFTDIDRALAGGVVLGGSLWKRPQDKIGVGFINSDISAAHSQYLALGGTGFIIGDGALRHKAHERVAEVWYRLGIARHTQLTLDAQYVANPGYNQDRGSVTILGARLHWEH